MFLDGEYVSYHWFDADRRADFGWKNLAILRRILDRLEPRETRYVIESQWLTHRFGFLVRFYTRNVDRLRKWDARLLEKKLVELGYIVTH